MFNPNPYDMNIIDQNFTRELHSIDGAKERIANLSAGEYVPSIEEVEWAIKNGGLDYLYFLGSLTCSDNKGSDRLIRYEFDESYYDEFGQPWVQTTEFDDCGGEDIYQVIIL